MTFRITILCENTVGPISGTLGEHGFAALIEPAGTEPLLFDTGQGMTLLHNARRMNKNLADIRKVVISHGHHDHAGGLFPLLQKFGPMQILGHPGIFSPRFRVKDNGEYLSIGIPQSRSLLEEAGATFDLSSCFREIAPGVFLTGEVPRSIPFEIGDKGLFCDCTGQQSDNTPDDQTLILDTSKGLVLVLGCCHAGIRNTIEHVTRTMDRQDIYAIIGGTHLGFYDKEQIDNTISVLKKAGIRKLAAGHCTGFAASVRLSLALPKVFQPAHVGYTLEV